MARIWIIDDEPTVCLQLHTTLTLRGDRAETFGDGESALQAIDANPPDLIVCDVNMPRVNGYEVLHAVRANPHSARVPVILMTGRATFESMREGMMGAADDYLPKPFSSSDLFDTIDRQLKLHHAAGLPSERAARALAPEVTAQLQAIAEIAQLLETERGLPQARLTALGRQLREGGDKLRRLLERP